MDVFSLVGRVMLGLQLDGDLTKVEITSVGTEGEHNKVPTYAELSVLAKSKERFRVTFEATGKEK